MINLKTTFETLKEQFEEFEKEIERNLLIITSELYTDENGITYCVRLTESRERLEEIVIKAMENNEIDITVRQNIILAAFEIGYKEAVEEIKKDFYIKAKEEEE